jgi:hypothetical protein
MDALMRKDVLADHAAGEPLDRGADAGRAKAFVELAPADDAVVRRQLDEMVVSPARVAGEDFEAGCL